MTTQSFLGIPIDGEIVRAERKVQQRPLADLAPLLQAVLDDDGIACFGWHQFTPYFNDGDPCVFSAGSVWVARHEDLRDGDPDDEDYGDEIDKDALGMDFGSPLGSYEGGEWVPDPENPPGNIRVGAHYEGPDKARYDRCLALADAVDSGVFDDVLLEAFGDHAEITVKRDGITVDFYEHD
jgi:hypothetical protein